MLPLTWQEEIGAALVRLASSSVLPELELGGGLHSVTQRGDGLQQTGLVELGRQVNVGDLEGLYGGIDLY